jgi:hypothetical protein
MKPVGWFFVCLLAMFAAAFWMGLMVGSDGVPARPCSPNAQLTAMQQKLDRVEAILVQHWGRP